MPIILSQRINIESDYDDVPFQKYHYPKIYKNQIKSGDLFIYYQGDRRKKENRFYYGVGVIGAIKFSGDGETYYADIMNGEKFKTTVPIHNPCGGYYEEIGFNDVRNSQTPNWRTSIRKISKEAFDTIIEASKTKITDYIDMSRLESERNPISVINELNEKYKYYSPEKKNKIIKAYVDRGSTVVNSLKQILGPFCQICGSQGFIKKDNDRYIEGHHVTQVSSNSPNSLCSDNIILVCPNCHRELHYGKTIAVEDRAEKIYIKLGEREVYVNKNTESYLHLKRETREL